MGDFLEEIVKAEKQQKQENFKKTKKKKIILSTTFALTGAALIITPVVVYRKQNSVYEITIESSNNAFQAYAMTLKRGATIANLKNNLLELEGHVLKGVFRDQACTIEYLDTDKVTKNSVVYLKYEKLKFSINLPTSNQFNILYSTSIDIDKIEWGDSFSFRVIMQEAYSESNIEVRINNEKINPDQNGFYHIPFVDSNTTVEIEGLEINTYQIESIPTNVTVFDGAGNILTENDQIKYGDTIKVTYETSAGHTTDSLVVNGEIVENGTEITVKEDLVIEYFESLTDYSINLPVIIGANIVYDNIDLTKLHIGDAFRFKVVLDEAYSNSNIVVVSNGETVTKDADEYYTVVVGVEDIDIEINNLIINTYKLQGIRGNVIVKDSEGNILDDNSTIIHGSSVFVGYMVSRGYRVSLFKVNGNAVVNEQEIVVNSNLNIEYEEIAIDYTLTFAHYDGCDIIYDQSINLTKLNIGDVFEFTINLSENYSNSQIVVKANGQEVQKNGETYSLTIDNADISIIIEGLQINTYRISSLPEQIVITNSMGQELQQGDVLTYGDVVSITYEESEGYAMSSFVVNEEEIKNHTKEITITEDLTIEYQEVDVSYLVFEENENTYTITGYSGRPTNVVIPTTYKKTPITSIADQAFFECESIEEVNILQNSNLQYIGAAAFYNTPLSRINLENATEITQISSAVFYECKQLSNVVIPNKVTSIGNEAFYNCSISNISIPATVTTIGERAFSKANLQTVNIAEGSQLTAIYKEGFSSCSNLEYINIENASNLLTIGEYAFTGCQLGEFNMPSTVTTIDKEAFYGCLKLASIFIPEEVTELKAGTFANCGLTTVNIAPNSKLQTIHDGVFSSCYYLTSINIENAANLQSIGYAAFEYCNFEVFNMQNSVSSIGSGAFYSCGSLTRIEIPDGVTTIKSSTFEQCGSLTEVYFSPNSNVAQFESYAFSKCHSLSSINLENCSQLTNISYGCLESAALTSVTIPSNVTTLEEGSFAACQNLSTVVFQDNSSLNTIKGSAFDTCTSLISITLPASVQTIERYAFYYCYNLVNITFEEESDLSTIESGAFYGCVKLKGLVIPFYVGFYNQEDVFEGCVGPYDFNFGSGQSTAFTELTLLGSASYATITSDYYDYLFENGVKIKVLKAIVDNPNYIDHYLQREGVAQRTEDGDFYIFEKIT